MTEMITVSGLCKNFYRRTALDDLSLSVPQGVIAGLVGANGAGKTTLIRILLGLLEPSGGDVRVHGLSPTTEGPAIRLRTGYVPDDCRWYPWMTAEELCDFVGAYYPAWDRLFARELRERLGIPARDPVRHMSKGMKTRLMTVLSLAHRPELLLLDEPFSGLDPLARADVMQLVAEFAASGGTVLVASHQIADVERLCERIVMLGRGRLLLEEKVATLKEKCFLIKATFPPDAEPIATPPGAKAVNRCGAVTTVYASGHAESVEAAYRAAGASVERQAADLEQIVLREMSRE